MCAQTLLTAPLQHLLFPSLGQSLQISSHDCQFSGNSFALFSLHFCKYKAQILELFCVVQNGDPTVQTCPHPGKGFGYGKKTCPACASILQIQSLNCRSYPPHIKLHSLQL